MAVEIKTIEDNITRSLHRTNEPDQLKEVEREVEPKRKKSRVRALA